MAFVTDAEGAKYAPDSVNSSDGKSSIKKMPARKERAFFITSAGEAARRYTVLPAASKATGGSQTARPATRHAFRARGRERPHSRESQWEFFFREPELFRFSSA
jgi:hypothetical protein